ncbi:hypothetical protein HPB51_029242 [Rhipicephalus microplus]|uniref:THAP-type domain-containing protein n=1 Tax=Rhipicephalus microplus TaxID=6941 RepID=A0A9J6CVF9_RHIMP|nr:hypothetical protein HPB51_029242 [Rhipicephalus microplus]
MPGKCCVPRCNGNYKTGPKVHVFSFPQTVEASQACIRSITRENLVVSANSRVCERHFKAEDIVRETSYIDQATGRTVTAPLSRLWLQAEAAPTVFPDCPSYLSIESSRREDLESKRMRLEAASLEKVLTESILTAKKEEEADKLCDLKDVANFVRGKKLTFWHVIKCSDHVILAHICNDNAPWIKYSVVVKTNLTLTANVAKASVKRLGSKMVVPSVIDSKRWLLELLEGVEGFDSAQRSSSENSTADIFETVASLLNELYTAQESDKTPIIQLLAEQTTRAFIEICAYCFEELKMSFVLLGKFQTDLLEERFGCYRRLAGSQYHLSVRQIYECENKLRLKTTLPQISTLSAIDNDQNQNWKELQTQAAVPSGKFNAVVTQEALSKLKDVIPVVTYVAGYSVHIAVKR